MKNYPADEKASGELHQNEHSKFEVGIQVEIRITKQKIYHSKNFLTFIFVIVEVSSKSQYTMYIIQCTRCGH